MFKHKELHVLQYSNSPHVIKLFYENIAQYDVINSMGGCYHNINVVLYLYIHYN